MKNKEYIAKVSGDWRLVDSHEIVSGRIEVPEGADIFLLDESCGEDVFYFVKHDGEVFYEYYISGTDIQNNTWIKGTIKVLHEGMGKVLWQRNPETPNTSTQDKLKFIEKWLNGEKIQYILGIETDKTQVDKSQWHNFTEGAMQYIKRPDIKFREAPKYVTINGIEFKSVEKLVKYVKNNFDLEDGGVRVMSFEIVKINGVKNTMKYDQITKFYSGDGTIEAEYFYYNGLVNWILSYGFTKGSLNEMRKSKASKTKKPFFSLSKGWYSYGEIE